MSTTDPAAPPAAATPEELAARALEQEQLGRWEEASRLYALSFRGSLLAGDVEQGVDALRGQARVLIQEGRFDEAEELAALSREIAGRSGLVRSAARAVNVLGIVRYAQGDMAGARAYYQRALELALDVGDDELVGLACQNAGVIAYTIGDLREARSLYLESIGSFVRSGNTGNALLAYNNLGIASSDLREWLEAELYYSRGIEIAERISNSPMLARLYGNRAEPLVNIGEIDQALDTIEKAERTAAAVGDRLTLAHAARWRGAIARMGSDLPAAGAHLERALELAAEPSLERAHILRELALLRDAQGRADEARETYARAGEIFRSLGSEALMHEMERLAALA
jgi:tetratricopeptide (TPR) repeat protein